MLAPFKQGWYYFEAQEMQAFINVSVKKPGPIYLESNVAINKSNFNS